MAEAGVGRGPAPLVARGRDPRPGAGWLWAVPCAALVLMLAIQVAGANRPLFAWINGISEYTGTHLWAYLTIFGDSAMAFSVALPLVRRRPDVAWSLFLAAILAFLWSTGLKDWLDTPRPPAVLAAGTFNLIGPAPFYFSFPSGHSTTAFTLAGVLTMFAARTRWRLLFVGLACAVALSRIAVGVHWPLDVLGGAVVGWLSAWLGVRWAGYWTWGLRASGRWFIGVLFAAVAVMALAYHDTGYTQSVWLQRLTAGAAIAYTIWDFLRALRARRGLHSEARP